MTKKEKTEKQKEIVDTVRVNQQGRLLLAPRIGKTKIIIDIIKRDKPTSILWVTPSAKLAEEDIPQEFITWKAKKYIKVLKTVTWTSLDTIEGEYDIIVLDEEQHITEANSEKLRNGSLKGRVISMSGTPTKDKDKLKLIDILSLQVIYDISMSEAVDMGLLSNYKIKVLKFPYDKKNGYINRLEAGLKPIGTYSFENDKVIFEGILEGKLSYSKIISKKGNELFLLKTGLGIGVGYLLLDNTFGKVTNNGEDYLLKNGEIFTTDTNVLKLFTQIKKYNQKFEMSKKLFNCLQGRVLLFAGSIDQANEISEHVYHSKTDNKDVQAFIAGEIDKIAMVNSGGTGFTYKSINHLVISQADSDKNGSTSQKIARTLLKQGKYEATIWILCLSNTQDEKWVEATLENFDKEKVEYLELNKTFFFNDKQQN